MRVVPWNYALQHLPETESRIIQMLRLKLGLLKTEHVGPLLLDETSENPWRIA